MKRLTPVKAIRKFCLECMGGQWKVVVECPSFSCPLYEYRYGTNPKRKGIGNQSDLD